MKILYGTTNKAKLQAMRTTLESFDIELIGLAMVYLDVDRILICSIFGYYYMIITDCVNPQRTSIIKIDRNKKREEHHEENTIQ